MINSSATLELFLATLHTSPWVGLDTEADSLHAYPEKLCLLQVATAAGEVLIDPLCGLDLAPFFAAIADREILMHGADYDLRLLKKHHRFQPRAIFDTMLAARLLGQRQFGLGALVQHYLGVTLEKGSQKANWARRPLTPKMESYALHDVLYLHPLAERLRSELAAQGRLEWHAESCERLIQEAALDEEQDSDTVWRIKGSSVLGPAALAVLREVWQWREREAVHANLPPFFVMNHELLVRIAAEAAHGHDVGHLVPPRYSPRRRETLLKAVQHGAAIPAEHQPQIPKRHHHRLTMSQVRRLRDITRRRDRHAARLGIDSSVIASKPVLARLAADWAAHEGELMTWQKTLLQQEPERTHHAMPVTHATPPEETPEPMSAAHPAAQA